MDSWAKSTVVGRISGPTAVSLAALLTFVFGIEIDEETMEYGLNSTVSFFNGILALYGFAMAIRSKFRQKKGLDGGYSSCDSDIGASLDQKVEDRIREIYQTDKGQENQWKK